jgi:thiol:disulfide interchange protein DsbA
MSVSRCVFICALLALAAPVQASIVAGRDYTVLPAVQRPDKPGKIEVIEFFSWACPHCYEFYPALGRWSSKLPRDIVFKKVALGFGRPGWENLAKAYYALEVTGDLARLDAKLFEAIHKQRLPLFDEQSITQWVGKQGVDTRKFAAAYNSFGVSTRMSQSESMALGYKVEYVPTLAIDGRFTVTGDHAKMLTVSNELIAKARAQAHSAH